MVITNTTIDHVIRDRSYDQLNKRIKMTLFLAIVCVAFFVVTEAAYTELGTVYADENG